MIIRLGVVVVLIAAGLLTLQWLRPPAFNPEPYRSNAVAGATDWPAAAQLSETPVLPADADIPVKSEDAGTDSSPVTPAAPRLDATAVDSLRQTRNGDPRSPVIGNDERQRALPADGLRDNYDDYQQWQGQQKLAGYSRYITAANEKLAQIDQHLAWGAQNGVSEQQLAAAREKRQRLAQTRDDLLTQYPDLAPAAKEDMAVIEGAADRDHTTPAQDSERQE